MNSLDRKALKLAGIYTVCALAWIFGSDQLMLLLAPDLSMFSLLGQWKGMIFVLATALLFYVVVRRQPVAVEVSEANDDGIGLRLVLIYMALAAVIVLSGLGTLAYIANKQKQASIDLLQVLQNERAHLVSLWWNHGLTSARQVLHNPDLPVIANHWNQDRLEGRDQAVDQDGDEDDDHRDVLVHWLESYRGDFGFRAVALVNAAGDILLSAGTMPPLATPMRTALAQALETGAIRNSGLYASDASAPSRFDWVVPLKVSGTAKPALAVVLATNPDRELLSHLQAGPDSGHSVEVLLFRRSQEQIEFLSPSRYRTDRRFEVPLNHASQRLIAAQILRHPALLEQIVEGNDYRGQPVIGVVKSIPDTPWLLLAKIDKRELYGNAVNDLAAVAVADTLALLIAGVVLLLLYQRKELRHAHSIWKRQMEKSELLELLQAITEGSTDAIYAKDMEGRYLMMNRQAQHLVGLGSDMLGCTDEEIFPPWEARRIRAEDRKIMARNEVETSEEDITTTAGPVTMLTIKGPLHDSAGAVVGVFGISRDISERKRAEDRLRQASLVFESALEGVVVTDLNGRIQTVNRAFTTITGYSEEEVIGQNPSMLQSGRQDQAFYRELWRILRREGSWQGEIWNRRKNGDLFPEWLNISVVRNDRGEATHYVGVFSDISRLKANEEELERLAHFDPLTDLPNRRLIQLRLEHAIESAQRGEHKVGVLYLDLDRFKTINDSLGHAAGDELLVSVTQRLRGVLRSGDTFGRLGGDEFLVVLEKLDQAESAVVVASHILAALAQPVTLSEARDLYISVSIGISIYPEDGTTATELLRDADAAMYQAKDKGRNQFCFYTPEMNHIAHQHLEIESNLYRALERHELSLHYQPKVDLGSGRVCGAEALLRWQRSDGTMVPPGDFIPIAEKTPLILPIGNFVVDEACRQLREWTDQNLGTDMGECRVAINVSARQFFMGDFEQVLAAALERHDISTRHIEVELTESMLMLNPDEAVITMKRLKDMGVTLALDDFGTGYSSLAYLMRFPLDVLKIDASFIRSIGVNQEAATIVDLVIALAHRLGLRVVAEGVETEEQLQYLRWLRCDQIQGYLFSRPLPAGAFRDLIESGRQLPVTPDVGAGK